MAKNIIYCYSAGSNCLDMARNIARELGDTDIIMMRSFPVTTDARGAKRVGFIFPCYGGGLPGGVEEAVRAVFPAVIKQKAKKYRVSGSCIGCGTCVQVCPKQAINVGKVTEKGLSTPAAVCGAFMRPERLTAASTGACTSASPSE